MRGVRGGVGRRAVGSEVVGDDSEMVGDGRRGEELG